MKLFLVASTLLLAYNDAFVWMRRGEPGKPRSNVARNISKNGPATAEQVNLKKGSDIIRSGSNEEISHFERKLDIGINPGKYQIDDHRTIKVEAEKNTGIVSTRRFVRGLEIGVNVGLKPGKGKNGKSGKGRNIREIVNGLSENGGNPNRAGILNLGAHAACKDGNIRVVDNGDVAGNKEVEKEPKPGNNKVENKQECENKKVESEQKTENEQKPGDKKNENKQECGNNKVENGQKPGSKEDENGRKPGNKKADNDHKPCTDGKEPKGKVGKEHNGKAKYETENKLRNCNVTVKGKHSTKFECGVGKDSTVVQQNSNKNNTTRARQTRKVIRTVGEPRNPNKVFNPFSPVMI